MPKTTAIVENLLLKTVSAQYPDKKWAFVVEQDDCILVISNLHVMKSNAGYYIGRVDVECDKETGEPRFMEPYERNSVYYRTAEEAQQELDEDEIKSARE